MQGAAPALEGIPTSVKDEEAIAGLTPNAGLHSIVRNEPPTSMWRRYRLPLTSAEAS
jgi:Asp-tRNA(Asn)/Glu-tRNA(Gln) amidotransferase A subunit family amidase